MSTPCALCGTPSITTHVVAPSEVEVALCAPCHAGVTEGPVDGPHWRCLGDAVWSGDAAVQVLAWRLLHRVDAVWARDLLDIVYLEPDVQVWAEAGMGGGEQPSDIIHRDSNGTILAQGDTVYLIKDLPVKGAGFTAKRGTAVRGISLVADNAGQIEGRVDGQRIVILTAFVKKS
ncbi:MAG: alkylphosphonate utilization protein [Paracoccaceae bacterium]|nr:alkylphosphonate utilization protein [Paracoccaceae bacterium]